LTFETLSKAQLVMIAAIEKVTYGPVARSMPPIHTGTVTLKDITVLRGPAQKAPLACRFAIRQVPRPTFPTGDKLIVTASIKSGKAVIETHSKATEDNIKLAKLAVSVPVGWSVAKGGGQKPVLTSPWSALGKKAWPKGLKIGASAPKCSKTGRPVLLAGAGLEIKVAQIPPSKPIKWQNPYGDGKFKIELINSTAKPITVDALLTNGKKGVGREILWADSLVILCRSKSYIFAGDAGKITPDAKPLTLGPHKSVSVEINVLELKPIAWPRGGSRVYFQFCLGELAANDFFYYYSKLHDRMIPR